MFHKRNSYLDSSRGTSTQTIQNNVNDSSRTMSIRAEVEDGERGRSDGER